MINKRSKTTIALLNTISNEILSTDPSKSEAEVRSLSISIAIKGLVDAGQPIKTAFDAIMGAGQYNQLAGTTFQTLRANA